MKQKTQKRKMITRADIVLGLVLLAVGISSGFAVNAFGEEGNSVKVEVQGKLYGEYSLDKDREVVIDEDGHINKFIIKDGAAKMVEANCPDGYCLRDSAISKTNESIVCLPNKVIISTPLDSMGEVDSVSN